MRKIKTVSVVMCTYNGAKYLREQLDSIVNQTYPISELIVQDDCSIDETLEILREYECKYSYIHVFENDVRKGVNHNFFSVIDRATSEYVAVSDQDDIWELDKIETQVHSIGLRWLSFCFSIPFSDSVEVSNDKRIPTYQIERMLYVSTIPGHTMLFRKKMISKIPNIWKFSDIFVYDYLIQLVAAAYDQISFSPETRVNHRRFIGAATYTPVQKYNKTFLNILKNTKRTFFLYLELRPEIRTRLIAVNEILSLLPDDAKRKEDAMKLANSQVGTSFWDFCKTIFYCVKFKDRLFYTRESNGLLAVLRAIYFPISCSDYFRHLSNRKTK